MGKELNPQLKRSNLFLVRVWNEGNEAGDEKIEWHGKIQRVTDGEAYQFDSLKDLLGLLQEMLPRVEGDGP